MYLVCTCRQDGEDTGLLLLPHTVGCPAQEAAVVHLRGGRVEGRGPAPITAQYSGPMTNQSTVLCPLTNHRSVLPGGVRDDVPGRDGPQLRARVELPPAQVIM